MKTNQSIVEIYKAKTSWGRNEIKGLPNSIRLYQDMVLAGKTNLGYKEIIHLQFGYLSQELGFVYYDEFVNLMKEQKTMLGKPAVQALLKQFWENTNEDYKSNPSLFHRIKEVIVQLNAELKSSNSTQQLRIKFMEHFLDVQSREEKFISDLNFILEPDLADTNRKTLIYKNKDNYTYYVDVEPSGFATTYGLVIDGVEEQIELNDHRPNIDYWYDFQMARIDSVQKQKTEAYSPAKDN